MIEAENIRKKFIKKDSHNKKIEFYADDGISFKAKEGTILGILGPNGAGKTTLLRILAGIMDPTEGTVEIDGMNYKNNAIEIKKEIAFLSGNTKIYKDISPVELLTMCGEYYGLDKETLRKRINAIVKKLGMEEFKNQRIENLSTGQLQRTNLARCLIHDPKIYILDEATSGLDIISSKIILDFILEEKKKGKIVLYSTHYMEEAENICDEVLLIHKGKVITTGTPEEVNKKGKAGNLRDAFFNLLEDKYEN